MTVGDAFDSIGLLRSLSADVQEQVARCARIRTLGRNETLWHSGEATRSFHFVLDGRLKLRHTMESGRELMLELIGPGQLACGPAVCASGPYCCEAVSTGERTRVLSIPQQELFGALFGRSPAARQFVDVLAGRCMSMCHRLVEVGGRGVEGRVAALLLRLSLEHGTPAPQQGRVRLSLVLTRRDIAQLCGTSDETISRTMVPLERSGVVVRDDDGFLVDLPALRERAGEV